MKNFCKPKILVSKCLGFAPVRWNGAIIEDDIIKKMREYVEFIPVCPEVEIGLGVPRDPIKIVKKGNTYRLIQDKTGKDITLLMENFSKIYLSSSDRIDGIILKDRSPSCGIKNANVYNKDSSIIEKTSGFFAKRVLEKFSDIPIETEGRLNNSYIRENFLTKIFLISSFRSLDKKIGQLVQFHSENKFLFLSYNQKMLRELGKIVANHQHYKIDKVFSAYEETLLKGLKNNYRKNSFYNTFFHILGYFKDFISKEEKTFIINNLEDFKKGLNDLVTVIKILESYVIRFEIKYLKQQTLFNPFPQSLIKNFNE